MNEAEQIAKWTEYEARLPHHVIPLDAPACVAGFWVVQWEPCVPHGENDFRHGAVRALNGIDNWCTQPDYQAGYRAGQRLAARLK